MTTIMHTLFSKLPTEDILLLEFQVQIMEMFPEIMVAGIIGSLRLMPMG